MDFVWRYRVISLVLFSLLFAYCNAQLGIIASSKKKVQEELLLDKYTGAIAAYSTEYKLSSSYSDSLITVRRIDNITEKDFGALRVNNYLDTIAFKAFIGASSGAIVSLLDQTGNGRDAVQLTAASQPLLVLANPYGARLSNDFTNDRLLATLPNNTNYRVFISGWFGTQSYIGRTNAAGQTTIPFGATGVLTTGDISTVIYYPENQLNSTQIQEIITELNSRLPDYGATDILRIRWGTAGAKTLPALTGTNYQYIDRVGTVSNSFYSRTVIAKDWVILRGTFSSSTNIFISTINIQGQLVSIPNNVNTIQCHNNQLTGTIPALPSGLTVFYCYNNQLTGAIPTLPNSITLFWCQNNQLTGTIPTLPNNITIFYCNNNQLTSFSGTTVPISLGDFLAQNNLLPLSEIEKILAAFVAANRTTGTRVLNIGGTGNASIVSSAAAKANVDTLRARGWTVTVNGY
jgi:hypothetical protein